MLRRKMIRLLVGRGKHMRGRKIVKGMMLMSCVLGCVSLAEARNLSDRISLLFGDRGIEADVDRNAVPHRAHFTSTSLATLGLLVKQMAASAADFPAISTVP